MNNNLTSLILFGGMALFVTILLTAGFMVGAFPIYVFVGLVSGSNFLLGGLSVLLSNFKSK